MKNHLKKVTVFVINAAIVLIGVFLIKNYEKNKLVAKEKALFDMQSQIPEFEADLSGSNRIPSGADATSASIVNDAVNQADSSVSNVVDKTALPSQPVVSQSAPAKVVSSAPVKSSSPTKKVSTPKTRTS